MIRSSQQANQANGKPKGKIGWLDAGENFINSRARNISPIVAT
jgi:hypothetical protein